MSLTLGRRHAMGERPRDAVDVRALAGTREVVACRDGGLFPVLVAVDRAVVAVVRGGAGHLGRAGRLEVIRSVDGGVSWSPPSVIADSERDDRNPAVGVAPDGRLVLAYQRQDSYDAAGVYRPELRRADGSRLVEVVTTRSADGGRSWEPPVALGVPDLATGSPYGRIAGLASGELLLPIYHRADSGEVASDVVRSTDGGRTWGDPSRVAVGMNETALLALAGREVLAVLRGADPAQGLHAARSSDGGRTWSAPRPITRPGRHPADLTRLSTGEVLLTYGNRAPPYRIEAMVSRDGGETWGRVAAFSGPLYGDPTEEGRVTDFGYPSTVLAEEGRGVTMYYCHPAVTATDGGPSHLVPPYGVAGYRASAVSWREEELLIALAP